jgi:membrane fusion protein, multidrug efflux system
LLVETKRSVILVPNAALQRTSQQTFVYVVKPDHKVTVRQVKIGTTEGGETAIETGLSAGEEVVGKGVDKLREGSVVTVQQNDSNAQQENG